MFNLSTIICLAQLHGIGVSPTEVKYIKFKGTIMNSKTIAITKVILFAILSLGLQTNYATASDIENGVAVRVLDSDFIENIWSCETGDPTGAGPTAFVEQTDSSSQSTNVGAGIESVYNVKIYYNKTNLDSIKNSNTYTLSSVKGTPPTFVMFEGMECQRTTLSKKRGSKKVQFYSCMEGRYVYLELLNFTPAQQSLFLTCN